MLWGVDAAVEDDCAVGDRAVAMEANVIGLRVEKNEVARVIVGLVAINVMNDGSVRQFD